MAEKIDNIDVVKVGTNVLVDKDRHGRERLNEDRFSQIGLWAGGNNMVIVSSAAITAGMIATGTEVRPDKKTQMPELQRLASIGGRHLLNAWAKSTFRKEVGGLLLTRQELGPRRHERVEAMHVIHSLLKHRDLPVVNENDAITHEEIAFGDNDTLAGTLAARIAQSPMFGNNVRLFLLTDKNGVYRNMKDPSTRIPVIADTADYRHLVYDSESPNGTGGMITKFDAADIAKAAGVDTWIFNPENGRREDAVRHEIGTYFPAQIS